MVSGAVFEKIFILCFGPHLKDFCSYTAGTNHDGKLFDIGYINKIRPTVHVLARRTCVRPSVRSSVRPSVRPSVHPSIHPSIRPSIHPSIHQSTHPSIHPSIHTYIRICRYSYIRATHAHTHGEPRFRIQGDPEPTKLVTSACITYMGKQSTTLKTINSYLRNHNLKLWTDIYDLNKISCST
jgi:hypothetical protein